MFSQQSDQSHWMLDVQSKASTHQSDFAGAALGDWSLHSIKGQRPSHKGLHGAYYWQGTAAQYKQVKIGESNGEDQAMLHAFVGPAGW